MNTDRTTDTQPEDRAAQGVGGVEEYAAAPAPDQSNPSAKITQNAPVAATSTQVGESRIHETPMTRLRIYGEDVDLRAAEKGATAPGCRMVSLTEADEHMCLDIVRRRDEVNRSYGVQDRRRDSSRNGFERALSGK